MRCHTLRLVALAGLAIAAATGCDRAIEPFVPGEQPEQPDLSRIFPEGAERASKDGPMAGQAAAPAMPGGSQRGTPPPAAAASDGDAAPVTGTVTLAPEVERKVPAGAILFVIARGEQGGGPPLAVKRIASPKFPLEFSLGPGDRMIQQMPFVGPLQLSARLDADGNAMTRAPGDLQGAADAPAKPGDAGVAIVIDEVL